MPDRNGTTQRMACLAAVVLVAWTIQRSLSIPQDSPARASRRADLLSLPLHFEPNLGQLAPEVQFHARSAGYTVFFTPGEALFSLRPPENAGRPVVRMKLVGADPAARVEYLDPLPGRSHYLIGSDPARWRTNVPHFRRAAWRKIFPGVDLVFHGSRADSGRLEYDFVLAPGVPPSAVRVSFEGAWNLRIDARGDLLMDTPGGLLRQPRPIVYQPEGGSRRTLVGRQLLRGGTEVGFEVPGYDTNLPLVLDPVFEYSTYLGGAGEDQPYAIAVDSAGNAYVAGSTESLNFPTTGPIQASRRGSSDAFVTKINGAGTALVWSTYLGGDSNDSARAVAVDASGSAYLTGQTESSNFPTLNALRPAPGGGADAFVVKLNPAGSALAYGTYLGGLGADSGYGIAVDGSGNAYLAGDTESDNFPTMNPLQARRAAGTCSFTFFGFTESFPCADAFVTKLNPAGSALVYSTYLGGSLTGGALSGIDGARAIAIDSAGNAYVAGRTSATDFPTRNPVQAAYGGGSDDAFVAKLNPAGSALVYSTYLGGSARDQAESIAVTASGNATVAGTTVSTNFPTASPLQAAYGGAMSDAFVAQLNDAGSRLVYSTYLGGSSTDEARAVALDAAGYAYVVGQTFSDNFPRVAALQPLRGGFNDAFVSVLNASGSALLFSTFLGGRGGEIGRAVARGPSGSIYLTGVTTSTSLFTSTGAAQASYAGDGDGFVARLSDLTPAGAPLTILSGASFSGAAMAPESIVSVFGQNLAASAEVGPTPLVTTLAGTTVQVTDSAGVERAAGLISVAPTQVNFVVPAGTAPGIATITIAGEGGVVASGKMRIDPVAPSLFSANSDGAGVAAAVVTLVRRDGSRSNEFVFRFDAATGRRVAVPIDLRPPVEQAVLTLYGTGFRFRRDLSSVRVTIGEQNVEVLFAGAQGEFEGLDQLNVRLPAALIARDEVNIVLTVDGRPANTVTVFMGGRPRITAVAPNGLSVGAAATEVTITGEYLAEVNRLEFVNATGITVAGLRAAETRVTVQIAVSATASVGDRPFRLISPAGRSDNFNFLVRPAPGSRAPFIFNVRASSPLPVTPDNVAISGSFEFEDSDGDIVFTGNVQTSARIRVSGPGCTITGSGTFLNRPGQTSGRVDFVVSWRASSLTIGFFTASLRLIDAAGNESNVHIWEPGIWWCHMLESDDERRPGREGPPLDLPRRRHMLAV